METKLKTLINKLVQEELSLMEKKKKKEEPVELDIDTTIEEPSAEEAEAELAAEPAAPMDMDMSGGDSTEKTIGKGLQMALDAAKQLPDGEMKSKLIRQIGNTALFFLKTQIPTSGEQM
jgi:hypothetical protein